MRRKKAKAAEKGGDDGGDEEDERIVVADMSSNFISRKVDVSKYSVIFVSLAQIRYPLREVLISGL